MSREKQSLNEAFGEMIHRLDQAAHGLPSESQETAKERVALFISSVRDALSTALRGGTMNADAMEMGLTKVRQDPLYQALPDTVRSMADREMGYLQARCARGRLEYVPLLSDVTDSFVAPFLESDQTSSSDQKPPRDISEFESPHELVHIQSLHREADRLALASRVQDAEFKPEHFDLFPEDKKVFYSALAKYHELITFASSKEHLSDAAQQELALAYQTLSALYQIVGRGSDAEAMAREGGKWIKGDKELKRYYWRTVLGAMMYRWLTIGGLSLATFLAAENPKAVLSVRDKIHFVMDGAGDKADVSLEARRCDDLETEVANWPARYPFLQEMGTGLLDARIGSCYWAANDFSKVRLYFESALEAGGLEDAYVDHMLSALGWAWSHGDRPNMTRAVFYYKKAIERKPECNPDLYLQLSDVHLKGEAFAEAVAVLKEAVQKYPDHSEIQSRYSQVARFDDSLEKARAFQKGADAILAAQGKTAEYFKDRVNAMKEIFNVYQAKKDWFKNLGLESAKIADEIGRDCVEHQDWTGAAKAYRIAVDGDPDNLSYWEVLEKSYRASHQPKHAEWARKRIEQIKKSPLGAASQK